MAIGSVGSPSITIAVDGGQAFEDSPSVVLEDNGDAPVVALSASLFLDPGVGGCIALPFREPPPHLDGPNGAVTQGENTYVVENGSVSFNGKVIGTCDNAGNYSVELDGQKVAGNVGELFGASFFGELSDGTWVENGADGGSVTVGGDTYDIRNGRVLDGSEVVGSINDRGDFVVTRDGEQVSGSLNELTGATYDTWSRDHRTHLTNTPVEGTVELGTDTYSIRNGQVTLDGQQIGTVNDRGEFDVVVNGRRETGLVQDLHGVLYTGQLSSGERVSAGGPTGNVSAELLGLASLEYGRWMSMGLAENGVRPPSGHVEVYRGAIFHQGVDDKGQGFSVRIGTMNAEGEFNITVDGRDYSGVYTGAFRSM